MIFLFLFPQDAPQEALFNYSRPCCSVAQDFYTQVLDYTGTVSFEQLGQHKSLDEKSGLIYTCNYGLVDMAHLRDSADWTREALSFVKEHIGNKTDHLIKSDGAKRILRLKKMPVADLSAEDLYKISARIAYENAVWHELASGIDIIEFQWMSSFSPEDLFSDLVGTQLAVRSLQETTDFNQALTKNIAAFIKEAHPLAAAQTKELLKKEEGRLWKKGRFFSDLLVRNFAVYGEVHSYLASPQAACEQGQKVTSVQSEVLLSNGKPASDYFEMIIYPDEKMDYIFKKAGFAYTEQQITQRDFPRFFPVVEKYLQRDEDYLKDLAPEFRGCDKFNYYNSRYCLKDILELFAQKILN